MTTRNIVGLHLTAVPAVALPVHFTSISVSGTTLHITGTNGVSLGQYVLIGTTNLTTPLSLWTRILTNNFDISGHVDLSTNIINSAVPQEFYIIVQ
jgi:hypothetical protein